MKKSILFILIVSIVFQIGCTGQNNIKSEDKINEPDSINVAAEDSEILNISEDISDNVVELYGIDNATCIRFNDNALVGIVLAYGQEMTDDLKETIIHTVKEVDPQIENVHISLNEKTFRQIDDIILDLLKGESYDNYVDEISKIMTKIEKEK